MLLELLPHLLVGRLLIILCLLLAMDQTTILYKTHGVYYGDKLAT